MGAWRLGGVEVSDFRSWYEEYGQLIPAIAERRMPTFTEHAAFADENRERARAALDVHALTSARCACSPSTTPPTRAPGWPTGPSQP